MTFKIEHLHLKTRDPQKTAKWWVGNLGAKIVSDGTAGSLQLELDGLTLNVSSFIEGITYQQSYGLEHISIGVPRNEMKNVLNKLKSSGAGILQERTNPNTGQSVAFIETPEGIKLEIVGEG